METYNKPGNIPISQQSSTLSDNSFGSNSTVIASPVSPTSLKTDHDHDHISSISEEDTPHRVDSTFYPSSKPSHGLGITNLSNRKKGSTKDSQAVPGSADPLFSPFPTTLSDVQGTHYEMDEDSPYNPTTSDYEGFAMDSDTERLRTKASWVPGNDINSACRSRRPLATGRGSWTAVSILTLSIYSTVFSGIWLCIAIKKPGYDNQVTRGLTIKNVNVLCAAFARSIELTFITVFVALVGQILSTRAIGLKKGVTLAEMLMRSWASQPGSMVTQWESVRYAANTWLGLTALLVAVLSVSYTTASNALVAPHLNIKTDHSGRINGKVATSFANITHIRAQCTTPIPEALDPDNVGATCSQIQHSGQAYHNYMQYLANWVDYNGAGNGSTDLRERPSPVAMLYDNTTVRGRWTSVDSMASLSQRYNKRIVNNITMAMPHSGVLAAARGHFNGMIQPQDDDGLDEDSPAGLGEYLVLASVPSPVVNVLCAELTAEEMVPMIYNQWPTEYFNGTQPNATSWPNQFDLTTIPSSQTVTAVDDLFQFDDVNVHPIFPKWPLVNNTVFNNTGLQGRQSVYLLAISPRNTSTLCSIRAAFTPNCSTGYMSSRTGGGLAARCEDQDDALAYHKSNRVSPDGIWSPDWANVAAEWGLALALNDGIMDGQSSNARLLTQLIPTSNALDPSLPSISEALAVLAGNTLLLSALDSPFAYGGNYSGPLAKPAEQYQTFNATILLQTYTPGSAQPWQRVFFVVLALVFGVNLCCLAYFLRHGGHVTDYVEPQNLFCLSLLSSPSKVLAGACGGGPEKKHYKTEWNILLNEEHGHLELQSHDAKSHSRYSQRKVEQKMSANDVAAMYNKIRSKRTSML